MKITVPKDIENLLQAYADKMDVTPAEAGRRLFAGIGMMHRYQGSLKALGHDWGELTESLKIKPASSKRPAPEPEPTLTPEQVTLLETSSMKSGYADVYSATPRGWRARVRDPKSGDQVWLAVRKSAQTAAWDRYAFLRDQMPADPDSKPISSSVLETIRQLKERNPSRSYEDLRQEAEEMEVLRTGFFDLDLAMHQPPDGSKKH